MTNINRMHLWYALATLIYFAGGASAQDLQVVVEYSPPQQASIDFKFSSIPAISKSDAGNLASARLVGGQVDTNGAPSIALFDGKNAKNQDDPRSNFFLAGNQDGRLLIDVGKSIELRQFNSYSWHPFLRGPQVYTLYGLDNSASETGNKSGTDDAPVIPTNPAASPWVKIADVDTRLQHATAGGMYGVSIQRGDGKAIGTFRYLLMEISCTDSQRRDSQTFYSEIDILDGQSYPARPKSDQVDTLDIEGKYQITFDTSEMPELRGWVDEVLKPICTKWYPKIVNMFPSENYNAPTAFTIYFHRDMSGVANASGTRINCAGQWFVRNLNGEAPGSVVHEMVHIVQQYSGRRGRSRNPGWMVEGVADYVRWFLYEPERNRPKPDPRRANYDDSYRTTAAFIDFVVDNYDAELHVKMNAAMREGRYSEFLWVQFTGETPADLWKEYVERELK